MTLSLALRIAALVLFILVAVLAFGLATLTLLALLGLTAVGLACWVASGLVP